eukprot:g2839.t1
MSQDRTSQALQRMSPAESTALGIAAGVIEVAIDQPQLYWKNAKQQGLPFTLNPSLLYRGVGMSALNMGGVTGLQFVFSGMLQKRITGGVTRQLTDTEEIAAGFMGGAMSAPACCLWELIMIQQQVHGGSVVAATSRMINQAGPSVLGRGITSTTMREGMYTAGYLGLVPVVQRKLTQDYGAGPVAGAVIGSIASGLIAATLSHPLDTIKTCMQGDVARKRYGTMTQTARAIHSEYGVGGFFNGWFWRTSRMICAVFIISESKRRLAPLVFPQYFE